MHLDKKFEQAENTPNELGTDITINNIEDITANTATTQSDFNASFPADFGKFNSQQNPPTANYNLSQGQQLNAGSLITGEMAVNFLDIIAPTLLVLIFKRAADKVVSKKQFSLSAQEKETIKAPLSNYLQSVNFNVDSPLNALLLTLAMIYGMKGIEVMNEVPAGKFSQGAANVGEMTAAGTIKKDGRGRPKGTTKNK